MANTYLGKRAVYDLASSLLAWDGFRFPALSRCSYHAGAHAEHLSFHIGDRPVTFSVLPDSKIRCVEECKGFVLRNEGTLQQGWMFSHRYDYGVL